MGKPFLFQRPPNRRAPSPEKALSAKRAVTMRQIVFTGLRDWKFRASGKDAVLDAPQRVEHGFSAQFGVE